MAIHTTKRRVRDSSDSVLLKKLPRLLALCGFSLILFFVVSPAFFTKERVRVGSEEVPIVAVHQISEGPLPPSPPPKPKVVMRVPVTAYSSTQDQTDDTPFHTANGREVQDGIVAANFLPLGTRLLIPEVFGDKIFTVEDRMHERFDRHIDIWMSSREAAQTFGIRYLQIEML